MATRRGAELIGLPENFAFLGDDNENSQLYEYVEDLQKKYLIEYASVGVRER